MRALGTEDGRVLLRTALGDFMQFVLRLNLETANIFCYEAANPSYYVHHHVFVAMNMLNAMLVLSQIQSRLLHFANDDG